MLSRAASAPPNDGMNVRSHPSSARTVSHCVGGDHEAFFGPPTGHRALNSRARLTGVRHPLRAARGALADVAAAERESYVRYAGGHTFDRLEGMRPTLRHSIRLSIIR